MLGKNNPVFKYFMNSRKLQCVEVEKDVGVFVDKDLKFEWQINETIKKKKQIK